MDPASLQDASFWSGYFIIGIQVFLLIFIIFTGFYLIRRRQRMPLSSRPQSPTSANLPRLQELLNQAKINNPSSFSSINLEKGEYRLEEELQVNSPVQITGIHSSETRIVSKGLHPAMRIKDVDKCTVSNVTIEGKIECSNSQLHIENCEIVAQDDGICIDAQDGSTVTISGLIKGDGGVAIRARGESKVILKQPYRISDEDYVVMEPKSSITVQDEEKQQDDLPEPEKPPS